MTYWPAIVGLLTVVAFGAAWYQRTCALEATVQVVAADVTDLKSRTARIETSVKLTSEAVNAIQTLMIQRSLSPVVSSH
jgi:outer membrane murein-binding lipoprotein Lpp